MLVNVPCLDGLLASYSALLGNDLEAFRVTTYRITNFHHSLSGRAIASLDKSVIAIVHQDIGLWLPSDARSNEGSRILLRRYLRHSDKADWEAELVDMISHGHHVLATSGKNGEILRKSNWINATRGIRKYATSPHLVRQVIQSFPYTELDGRLLRRFIVRSIL